MTMKNEPLLEILYQNRHMDSEEEIRIFEDTLAQIASNPHDISLLPGLLRVFDDFTTHHNVMWSLLHYIESFGEEFGYRVYIKHVTEFDLGRLSDVEFWIGALFMRVINVEESRQELKLVYAELPEVRQQAIRQVLKPFVEKSAVGSKDKLQRRKELIDDVIS